MRIGKPNQNIGPNTDRGNASNATGFAPQRPSEAAMLVTREPGVYTAAVSSESAMADGAMKGVLVEAYEIAL